MTFTLTPTEPPPMPRCKPRLKQPQFPPWQSFQPVEYCLLATGKVHCHRIIKWEHYYPGTCMNLPTHPLKGQRRALDQQWLAKLHTEGRNALPKSIPEPPPEFELAVSEFNNGQFWECHETLERLWLPEQYPLRLFYHGLIKAAVGLLHLERHNRRGAISKLTDAVYTLAPFCPGTMGIDVHQLRRDIMRRLEIIQEAPTLGRMHLDEPTVQIRRSSGQSC